MRAEARCVYVRSTLQLDRVNVLPQLGRSAKGASSRRFGRAGRALTAVTLVLGLTIGALRAEDRSSPLQFWLQEAPQSMPHSARSPEPTFRPQRAPGSATLRPSRRRGPAVAQPVDANGNFVVAVFGDSLAQDVWRGLTEAYRAKPDSTVLDATSEDATLRQDTSADWNDSLAAALRRAGHLDAAVLMVGSSDDDALMDDKGRPVPVASPEWRQLFGERVERLATSFKEKQVPLIWVGLPVVRDGEQARTFADINAVLREHAEKAGAVYVDIWEGFTSENGQYDPFGPDVNGRVAKLRRGDGQRFTSAGARKLASFIEPDLKRDMDRAQASRQLANLNADDHTLFDQALQVDINAQIRREAGLPVGASPPTLRSRDLPVVELTAAPRATDGRLATLGQAVSVPTVVSDVLERGETPPPRLGRTDDFSWPRR